MERQTRRRAVRLKPEAQAKLQLAIEEAWQALQESGKLTREEKARILGLSLVTSERVLKGKGVDRPSLAHAFRRVGLKWEDDCCESCQPTDGESAAVESLNKARVRPSRRRIAWVAIASLMAIAAIPIVANSVRRESVVDWRGNFNRKISASELAFHRANFVAARALADEAIELAREHENAPCLAEALRMAGDLASVSSDFRTARKSYEEALTIRTSLNHNWAQPSLYEALGNVDLELGNISQARAEFQTSLDKYRAGKDSTGVAMAMRGLGTVAHRQQRLDEASQWFESGLTILQGGKKDDLHVDIESRLALVWRDQGHLERADSALRRALQHWETVSHRRWIAKAQMQLATVLKLSGQTEEAADYLNKSRMEFQRLGDHAGAAECQEWLDQPVTEFAKRVTASPE